MKELNEFLARENQWSSVFGRKPLTLERAKDRLEIAERIDSQLSPENLSCDGELAMTEVRRRLQFLTRAAEQLLKLDSTVIIHELA
jgi:hypothetical protein